MSVDYQPRFNVVFATDSNYLPYAQIALKSLLAHHDNLYVFIISNERLDEEFLRELQGYCSQRTSQVAFVHVNQENDPAPCTNGYITKATYLRYYISQLFGYSSGPNWLYLDCDIVVNGRLDEPFYLKEFATLPLAAVKDPFVAPIFYRAFNSDSYFNAGVLYINAKNWTADYEQLNRLTAQYADRIVYGDQDILNLVFTDRWLPLDMSYNLQLEHILGGQQSNPLLPKILHFTGPKKPLDNLGEERFVEKLSPLVQIFQFYHQLSWQELLDYPVGALSFDTANWQK